MGISRAFGVRHLLVWVVGLLSTAAASAPLEAVNIVRQCDYKNPGDDQRSTLSIALIDKDGNERKNVYLRLWKNYKGEHGLLDKMVLFTQFPPDAKGTGFLRWGYVASENKLADQWIYLPQLRKIRRVSVRDLGDSFLGSDLTYGDIEDRSIDADKYVLAGDETSNNVFVVEAYPKEENALYSKKVSRYEKGKDWDSCVRTHTDYFDRHGTLLKKQALTWQKVESAWVWDTVMVENVQTRHKSVFTVTDVAINVGLKERTFTERSLKRGP